MPESDGGLEQQIVSSRRVIERMFVEQCRYGAQGQNITTTKATACGQFIGEGAKDLTQRGIHGTAAALRVLAESADDEAAALVNRLFHYLQNRPEIEKKITRDPVSEDQVHKKCSRDGENVIKVAEVLDALSFAKSTLEGREAMVTDLVSRLKKGIHDDKGWGFFLDKPGDPVDVLPTAYAVLALGRHGLAGEIRGPARYLAEQLKRKQGDGHESRKASDITSRVMALYALTFGGIETDELPAGEARRVFRGLWSGLEKLLGDDLEQNVEYWRESRTYYVRVPWSLYILALAARHDFWKFGSNAAQARLSSILKDANEGGFRYPYSGRMLSSRTSAILYDVLGNIARDANRLLINPIWLIDRVRSAISSALFRVPVGLVAGGYTVYSAYCWMQQGTHADLAPEFVAPALTSAFMLLVKSR